MSLTASAEQVGKPKENNLNVRLYTSGPVWRLLRIAADMKGFPSPDHLATDLLRRALDDIPGIAEADAEYGKLVQKWRAAFVPQNTAQ